jgi:hypothetical protein
MGVVQLIWRQSGSWRLVHLMWPLLGTVAACCLGVALIAGGIALMWPQRVRPGAIAVGAVYLLFALACIPAMIGAPSNWVNYVDFFETFSVVCGALTLFAANPARLAFGVCTLSFAWAQIVYLQYTASLVPAWLPPNQVFWTNLTTLAFALAAVALLVNRYAHLATMLLVVMLVLFGVLVWVPRLILYPGALADWNEIASNYLMAGAAWMVLDTLGQKPTRHPALA